VAVHLLSANSALAITVFSYDPSSGQLPTSQGWGAFEVDTTGPLTGPSAGGVVTGTASVNANAAIEMVDGVNVLHIRDTLTDSSADLPEFYYPWTPTQQQLLIANGLKFTLVIQGLTNATSNGNMRFGFNGTEFELQNDNIGADRTIQVTNFGGGLFPIDGAFHTLVVTGQKSGSNFDFSYTVDGGSSTPMTIDTNPAPAGSAFESTVYFGALSSAGRNSDFLVKSVLMETLGVVAPQTATITRTNNSPYGSLTFTNNSSPITIVGYSILSKIGALKPANWTSIADTYDLSGNHSVDPNDDWLKLTNTALRTDLSEFEPDGDGATLAMGQSITFGNVWIQNPTEDVSMQLLLSDGTVLPVSMLYSGNGDNRFDFGDLDFDGDFDVADFTGKFVPGFGANTSALSAAEKYQAGDFNEDNVVDEYDFLIYNEAYLAANPGAGSLSFGMVPEPGIAALLAASLLAGALVRRRSRRFSAANLASLLLVASGFGAVPASTHAANPIAYWNFDEAGGATVLTDTIGASHSTSIGAAAPGAVGQIGGAWTFSGADNAITIDTVPGVLTGLGLNYSFSGWVKSTDTLGVLFSISDNTQGSEEVVLRVSDNAPVGRAGLLGRPNIDGPGGEALGMTFINDNKWHHVAFTSNPAGWNIYVDGVKENSGLVPTSPLAIGANAVHIGVNQDNTAANSGLQWGLLGLLDDLSVWDGPLTDAEVASIYVKGLFGHPVTDNFTDALSLDVSRTGSGAVTLKNTGATGFEIDLYRVVSGGSSLQASSWNSLDNENFDSAAWTELANGAGKVSEGAFGDSTLLAGGFSQSLGNLYNTSIDAQDLVLEYHLVGTPTSLLVRGNVNYLVGGVPGDFNNDNKVNAADYVLWRKNPGAFGGAGGYATWRANFGSPPGSGSSLGGPAAVPEPAVLSLVLIAGLFVAGRRRGRGRRACLCFLALLAAAVATPVAAASYPERNYTFGDDSGENGGNPAGLVGQVLGVGTGGTTYDSAGTLGAGDLQDLLVNGNPTYVSVSTRPGAGGNSLGAAFDGDDGLNTSISMNAPSQMWNNATFFPGTPFPHNYQTIFSHGINFWAKPDQVALTAGNRQDLVIDTPENGVYITTTGTWALQFDGGGDSGVSVASTLDPNGWAHVMEVGGLVDPIGGTSAFQGALYVNGVAVIATAPSQAFDANSTPLSIGSNQAVDGNFYTGVLDDVRLFLWGDNTGQDSGDGRLGQNWGTLDLAVDNDWIAQKLASLGVTNRADVNLNGSVFGDGTGPAASDDVTAFIQGWRSQRLLANGVQVGDWISRQQGDLNYDGIVDLSDAYILRLELVAAGGAGFDFSLLDSGVPEPSTPLLIALGTVLIGTSQRRRRKMN
jgi:hypothetical protein